MILKLSARLLHRQKRRYQKADSVAMPLWHRQFRTL
jgi:hypothetical protein